MYYIVMLKDGEKRNQVFGTERQMIERHLPLDETVKRYTLKLRQLQRYQGNIRDLMGINRMEVYSFGDFYDDRSFRLETTVY